MSRMMILVLLVAAVIGCAGASSPSDPLEHLAPSMAATSVYGTVLAAPCRIRTDNDTCEDGILILSRSADRSLPLIDSESQPGAKALLHRIGTQTVAGLTGFAPEVYLVVRLLHEIVDQYRQIYSSHGVERTPRAITLMYQLAQQFQVTAQQTAGRPLGVAVLMVGRSTNDRYWHVYTLDPAGNLRSRIGVIGKYAAELTPRLQKLLVQQNQQQSNWVWSDILQQMIQMTQAVAPTSAASSKYEAALLCWRDGAINVQPVEPSTVQACLDAIANEGK